MGGSEIIVILVVALIFLGPDKLPGAAKSISKGIRDIKKQSRALQMQIENDEQIGGAIRDLKSALRDEPAPRPLKPRIKPSDAAVAAPALAVGVPTDENSLLGTPPPSESATLLEVSERSIIDAKVADTNLVAKLEPTELASPPPLPRIKLPPTAGEPGDVEEPGGDDDLASLIKPASGSVAKGS